MSYCISSTWGSPDRAGSEVGSAYGFSSLKLTPSMKRDDVDRSAKSAMHRVQTLLILIWSLRRPSTRLVVSSVIPDPFVSYTRNLTDLSPMKRNLQAQAAEAASGQSASKSSAAASTRTRPSTLRQTSLLCCNSPVSAMSATCLMPLSMLVPALLMSCALWPTSFFSRRSVCSAYGPSLNFQLIFVVPWALASTERGSEVM
mmetsp:Transcript_69337/g.206476  ORF Transcript_69337/g.206476 Transcript_69337/m.206476 type:complete len:201 (+) Transcript_69337:256-858(+)